MITKNIEFKNFNKKFSNKKILIDLKKLLKENNVIIKSLGSKYKNNYNNKIIKKYQKFKDINSLIPFLSNDKKNEDKKINFILLKNIGKTTQPGRYKISVKELKNIIKKIIQY